MSLSSDILVSQAAAFKCNVYCYVEQSNKIDKLLKKQIETSNPDRPPPGKKRRVDMVGGSAS